MKTLEPTLEIEQSLRNINFINGLPGFPNAHLFEITPISKDMKPFCILKSKEVEGLEFVAIPPHYIFPEYEVELDDNTVKRLEIEDSSQSFTLVIIKLATPPKVPTANLLGPIIINIQSGLAMQVVLHNSEYQPQFPLTIIN